MHHCGRFRRILLKKVGNCVERCSLIQLLREAGLKNHDGHQVEQAALFYEFSLETHVPTDHRLRSIDRFVELGEVRRELASFYSTLGRPSIDPELMIRMLIVGYCFGIRSEPLCEEVHLNLAYRWFCRLGLDGDVPDHSTFSKNRHGRFREGDLLPKFVSPADPAARWTRAHGGQAFFAYSTNYLIDVDNGIIVDVEATTAIRQPRSWPQSA
jgi:transposase